MTSGVAAFGGRLISTAAQAMFAKDAETHKLLVVFEVAYGGTISVIGTALVWPVLEVVALKNPKGRQIEPFFRLLQRQIQRRLLRGKLERKSLQK